MTDALLDDTDEEFAYQKWEKENSIDGLIMEHLPDPPPPVDLEYFLYGSYSDDEAKRIFDILAQFFVEMVDKRMHFFIPYHKNQETLGVIHWANTIGEIIPLTSGRKNHESSEYSNLRENKEIRVMDPETNAAADCYIRDLISIDSLTELLKDLFGAEYVGNMIDRYIRNDSSH